MVAALELSYSAATVMSSGNTGAFGRREDRPGGGGERGGGGGLGGIRLSGLSSGGILPEEGQLAWCV